MEAYFDGIKYEKVVFSLLFSSPLFSLSLSPASSIFSLSLAFPYF
jgi:hypothetical protein